MFPCRQILGRLRLLFLINPTFFFFFCPRASNISRSWPVRQNNTQIESKPPHLFSFRGGWWMGVRLLCRCGGGPDGTVLRTTYYVCLVCPRPPTRLSNGTVRTWELGKSFEATLRSSPVRKLCPNLFLIELPKHPI
ncbi:hypothetical protein BGZ63DRAFT_230995 [Mariannaea sp. PMI_226]|nr:hypothetical protein BGZ63DRAFT_230995 [Mariannaea sp. PMI_226]